MLSNADRKFMEISAVKKTLAVALLAAVAPSGALWGQQFAISSSAPPLKAFLRGYLNTGQLAPDRTTRITAVSTKAETNTAEVELVYVSGQR